MSGFEAALLGKLKEKQAEYAIQALRHPGNRDAFEYGYRCGTYNGLDMAQQILLDLLKERDSKDL